MLTNSLRACKDGRSALPRFLEMAGLTGEKLHRRSGQVSLKIALICERWASDLEAWLREYLDATGVAGQNGKMPLFRAASDSRRETCGLRGALSASQLQTLEVAASAAR